MKNAIIIAVCGICLSFGAFRTYQYYNSDVANISGVYSVSMTSGFYEGCTITIDLDRNGEGSTTIEFDDGTKITSDFEWSIDGEYILLEEENGDTNRASLSKTGKLVVDNIVYSKN